MSFGVGGKKNILDIIPEHERSKNWGDETSSREFLSSTSEDAKETFSTEDEGVKE